MQEMIARETLCVLKYFALLLQQRPSLILHGLMPAANIRVFLLFNLTKRRLHLYSLQNGIAT